LAFSVHSLTSVSMTRLIAYAQAVGLGHKVRFVGVTTPGALPVRRHVPLVVVEAGSCEADPGPSL
jgi:hypothetical protein